MAFDLVMFDLDGTLVATASELCDAVNDTLAGLQLGRVSEAQVTTWIGHGTRALLAQALANASSTAVDAVRQSPLLDTAAGAFDAHYLARCGTRSALYPHALAALRHLQRSGVHLALVTNKDSRYSARLLEQHGLTALMGLVVGGDSVAHKKPAPDGILLCLRHFKVAPDRALFVGDSSIDVASARNAGVPIWALAGGYNLGQPITVSRPDRVIDDLAALLPH